MSTLPGSTKIVITDDSVIVPFEIAPGINADKEIPIKDFILNISSQTALDTEIMPVSGTGLLALRQLGKYRQIVFQIETGIVNLTWGRYERDSTAETYRVASPYRVIIADLFDGDLLGARMFYSPSPIASPADILYNINLPNVNCRGYGPNNAVGWLCLYLKESWKNLTIVQQILAINERAGGDEAYNDQNMNETDGTRYYKQYRNDRPEFYDPQIWESKTNSDGIDWVNDPELLLPVYVKDENTQHKNFASIKEGKYSPDLIPIQKVKENEWDYEPAIALTVDMAMRGSSSSYYTDDEYVKPINILTNPNIDKNNTSSNTVNYRSIIERSINMGSSYGITARERPIVKNDDEWNFGSDWTKGNIKEPTKQVKEKSEVIEFTPKKIGFCKISSDPIYEGSDYIEAVFESAWPKPVKVLLNVYEKNIDLFVETDEYQLLPTTNIFHVDAVETFTVLDKQSPHNDKVVYVLKKDFQTIECDNCKIRYLLNQKMVEELQLNKQPFISNEKLFNAYCSACSDLVQCEYTNSFVPKQDITEIEAFDPIENKYIIYAISKVALIDLDKCACDKIIDESTSYAKLDNLGKVCSSCIKMAEDGNVDYLPVNTK